MSRLKWGEPLDKTWQAGLSHGVLYPPSGPAVPWNGLISVDESGSQESNHYYVDGRHYLSTVTPREYSAKLSCYTFPDEFAELCGLYEVADGLILDSQQPDRFGLSYRTGGGDGVGNEFYKIHCIYGVMAAASDTSYQTIGADTEPTAFQFDISAIPESIAGFRPTAHVIIDTRHMSPDKIIEIENILYGTWHVNASLPPIQTFFDMMSYGEIVVIRDNGDGTWEAEGSRKYIQIFSNGDFQVDNVTAVFHADGTYDVSDTTV